MPEHIADVSKMMPMTHGEAKPIILDILNDTEWDMTNKQDWARFCEAVRALLEGYEQAVKDLGQHGNCGLVCAHGRANKDDCITHKEAVYADGKPRMGENGVYRCFEWRGAKEE